MGKRKILISCMGLYAGGGIDSALVNLIYALHEKYEITLFLAGRYHTSRYPLPDDVTVLKGSSYMHDVGVIRKWQREQGFFRRILRNLRRIFKSYLFKDRAIEWALDRLEIPGEYDVAIAFADYLYNIGGMKSYDFYIVLNRVNARRKIAWNHNNPAKLGWTKDFCESRLAGLDAIVSVSETNRRIFSEIAPSLKDRFRVVYNFYDIDKIRRDGAEEMKCFVSAGKLKLVTVSRAVIDCKRLDRVIRVCRRLKDEGICGIEWLIVGDGDDLEKLKRMAHDAGVEDMVRFAGWQKNPYPYMKQADALVISSEFEAFPMVVREAEVLGTPVLTTRYPSAHEAVEDGVSGEICVNSTDGLYEMIKGIFYGRDRLATYRDYLVNHPVDNTTAARQFDEACFPEGA